MPKKVIKRDGTLEDFEPAKIERVVTAAGLHTDQAHMVTATVTEKIASKTGDSVSSLEVRDILIEQLKQVNENAAGLYVWYEKTKDKTVKKV